MSKTKQIIALFDLDGVVIDTERQYTGFWHEIGVKYLNISDFEKRIKGQTLAYIYDTYFRAMEREQQEVTELLNRFEQSMTYDYVPGVQTFITDLRNHGVKTAVVTSSNLKKMESLYLIRPELKSLFDAIFTAEDFARSKPHPDCFLLGMSSFGADAECSYVFEDSFNGLKAALASGATVVGLTTTNPRKDIEPFAHYIIDDFKGMTYDALIRIHAPILK